MRTRLAVLISLFAGLCASILVAALAGSGIKILDVPFGNLWLSMTNRWPEVGMAFLLAYALTATILTTIPFATRLGQVSVALRRLQMNAATRTIEDYSGAFLDAQLQVLGSQFLRPPLGPHTSPADSRMFTSMPSDAAGIRREIFAHYARRLSVLQIWSAIALLSIGSVLFLMGLLSDIQTVRTDLARWVPVCATLLLMLMLVAGLTWVGEKAEALATIISRFLPTIDQSSPEETASRRPIARLHGDHLAAAELRNEIVELRVRLLDILERQHQDVVDAMRNGLRDGLAPLSQRLMQVSSDRAEGDQERIVRAIADGFDSLADKIDERASAPLNEAKKLIEATLRAAASLSGAVRRLRHEGGEQHQTQSERVASLAGGLIAPESHQMIRVAEQYEASSRLVAEVNKSAINELGGTVRDAIDRLAALIADVQADAVADRRALRQQVEKLGEAAEGLSAQVPRGSSPLSKRAGGTPDNDESSMALSRASIDELAGLLEKVRSALEQIVDATGPGAISASATLISVPTDPAAPEASLRDELKALRLELEAGPRDLPGGSS